MLVLTRKSGEKLRIGNNIIITILNHSYGQIKMGIEAPPEIPIYREEIYNRIRKKNQASVLVDAPNPNLLKRLFKGMK